MILGVTGRNCSGKDSVANILIEKGFLHISLSDILREATRKKATRQNLFVLGNELRQKYGAGYLARKALQRMQPGKNYVVSSIRNPTEVEVLKTRDDFALIGIKAPEKCRFERLVKRNKTEDKVLQKFEDFMHHEKEEEGGDPTHQQLLSTIRMSDVILNNDKGLEQLHKKVTKLVYDLKDEYDEERPDWDVYFNELAKTVGLRGTCDRGKSGAVLVKDKRIISTGYVGAAVGLAHCDEVGHLMHEVTNPDGSTSKHCIRTTHAEQNAIVQAARHGVSIKGATIYCKMEPCYVCAMMIINAGITRVVAEKKYHRAQLTREMLKQAGVELVVLNKTLEKYSNQ